MNDFHPGSPWSPACITRTRTAPAPSFASTRAPVQTDLAAQYHAAHPTVPVRSLHDPLCYFPMSCIGGTGNTPSTCTSGNWNVTTGTDTTAWRLGRGLHRLRVFHRWRRAHRTRSRILRLASGYGHDRIDAWDTESISVGVYGVASASLPARRRDLLRNDPGVTTALAPVTSSGRSGTSSGPQ